MNKKTKSIDPLAEVKKSKNFEKYSKEARDRIKLAVEIYNAREVLKMSQQKLAKLAETTQKVISKIENGDVNIGYSLLNRVANVLNFNCQNWSNVFGFNLPPTTIIIESSKTANKENVSEKYHKYFTTTNSLIKN